MIRILIREYDREPIDRTVETIGHRRRGDDRMAAPLRVPD
jgi:hypothetical protein